MEFRQSAPPESARSIALATEQDYVRTLYERLDMVRAETEQALREAHGRGGTGTLQARIEREVTAEEQARRLSQLSSVDRGLCFGRIDHRGIGGSTGETLYIGRIGLRSADYDPLLIDWRAPAAEPFYAATPNSPGTLVRRRHLHTRDRRVVEIDDEVFDLDGLTESDRRTLVGEAALLATLRRGRTGRMSDVVSTIQTEQDRVIRSGLAGVLVVQGGPGTGKTVAALHRAAYLLYTHRRTLARRGVLVIGPNSTFLRYIGQVLPSLGETDVVLSTLGDLFPGVTATATESHESTRVKGDLRMAELIRSAVRGRQRAPRLGIEVCTDGMVLRVDGATCQKARDRGRSSRRPHNLARKTVVRDLLTALARDQARQLSRTMDEEDLLYARSALWEEAPVRAAIDRLWPFLTPQQLLSELFASPDTLRAAASGRSRLSEAEQQALLREPGSEWTVADVPLLDEAAELLGEDDSAAQAMARVAEQERRAEEHYAQGVLELTGLAGQGFIDARTLAERHRDTDSLLTTAERAGEDRTWAYGHVIVDEAQELSAMAWRMVMRRVPTRSMTVVGDIAQTGSPAGARSWGQMLDPYVRGRWREERLLVNYRTPAEIMTVAADVLAEVAPEQEPPESVRQSHVPPRAVRADEGGSAMELPALVKQELAAIGEGRLAVIAPDARLAEVRRALPEAALGSGPKTLESTVAVLTTAQAKGLEFDSVIVLAPSGIVAQSPQGGHDLYVAITRATRRLTVVHEGPLPRMLEKLRSDTPLPPASVH